jgi:hypothetical protein
MLPAQRICAPPHLVITGTDHLTIHPVGYYVVGQSTHQNFKVIFVCIHTDTSFSRGEKELAV